MAAPRRRRGGRRPGRRGPRRAAHGVRLDVWTVNDPDEVAAALAGAGVDALITDVPDVVLAAVR